MTHADFSKMMGLLIDTYGEKAYPTPRVTRIWGWARKLNGRLFELTVENAIGDCERPPLISKLKEYYSEIRNKNHDLEKVKCDFCDGGGWIPDSQPLPTAYACRCEAGQAIPDAFKRWQGPWIRIVPRPSELMRTASDSLIKTTFGRLKLNSEGVDP